MSTGVFKASYDKFVEGDFDLGIEQAIGSTVRPPGLEALLLRREALTPVCSPLLLQAGPPTRRLTWVRSQHAPRVRGIARPPTTLHVAAAPSWDRK